MQTLRCLIAAFGAALLLAAATSGASARALSTSNQNLRVTFSRIELGAESVIIRCAATLEGSFHSTTIAKVARSLVGAITKATVKQESCTGGTAASFNGVERYNGTTTPNTLPWHITFELFFGTLPRITRIRILFRFFRFGLIVPFLCTGQYGAETDNISSEVTREEGGGITRIVPVEGSNTATLVRADGGICPASGRMVGGPEGGETFVLGAATRITVTLI